MHSISVVIPNYNGRQLLNDNLPLMYEALRKARVDYEIIISDDCSTDDSVTFIKNTYPDIILLQQPANKGFSATINKGIMHAGKDLVLALNSDVKLLPDYFTAQFKYFERSDTFGVMGKIIGVDTDEIQDGAKYPAKKGLTLISTINYVLKEEDTSFWTPSLFLSGANALMDRKKLQELQGFDEIYSPFYKEDVDLCIRAWRLGWKCYYEGKALCRHPASTTIASYNKKKKIKTISLRNKIAFHNIHLQGFGRLLWNVRYMANIVFGILVFRFYYLSAFQQFLSKRTEVIASRNALDRLFKKHSIKKSINDICREIKTQIGSREVRKF